MKSYLLNLWDTVRTGYWFIPTLLVTGAVCLFATVWMAESRINDFDQLIPTWIQTTPSTARATLSAILGAIIAVTGTLFSVTVVVLSLTSQQFGPRLLRRFMYDVQTQITLGVFLATSVHCLLVLRVIIDSPTPAPSLSVATTIGFTILSMAALIAFIHHVAILIQAPNVVAAVAADLDQSIKSLFPDRAQHSTKEREEQESVKIKKIEEDQGTVNHQIYAQRDGYVQALDLPGITAWAEEHSLVVRLRVRPGDFIATGNPIADLWSNNEQSSESKDDEVGDSDSFNQKVIVGARRTPRQDVQCAIEELVEVAVRSLSPGINDPFTAINCIDRLGASISRFSSRDMPSRLHFASDELRVVTRQYCFAEILDTAFNQIRQNSKDHVAVLIRLVEALSWITTQTSQRSRLQAIQRQCDMTARLAQTVRETFDRQDILDRSNALNTLISEKLQQADEGGSLGLEMPKSRNL